MKRSQLFLDHGAALDHGISIQLFWIDEQPPLHARTAIVAKYDTAEHYAQAGFLRVPPDAVAPLDLYKAKIAIEIEAEVVHQRDERKFPTGSLQLRYQFRWTITMLDPQLAPREIDENRSRTIELRGERTRLEGMVSLAEVITMAVDDLQHGIYGANKIIALFETPK